MKGFLLALGLVFLSPLSGTAHAAPWSFGLEFPGGPFLEYQFAENHSLALSYVDWVDRDDYHNHPPRFSNHTTTSWLRYLLLAGDGNHRGEFGLALMYMNENMRLTGRSETLSGHESGVRLYLGYRYERPAGGVQLRAGFTVYGEVADHDAHQVFSEAFLEDFPWPYLSLGWGF